MYLGFGLRAGFWGIGFGEPFKAQDIPRYCLVTPVLDSLTACFIGRTSSAAQPEDKPTKQMKLVVQNRVKVTTRLLLSP